MTTVSSPTPAAAQSVPLSAMAIAEPPAPPAEPAPTWRDRLPQRLQPVAAYGMLFLMGLSGGLGVASAASLTIRYFVHGPGPDKQLAAVRFVLPRQAPEPLDVEIQKAKAELDAAVAPHGS